MASTKELAEGAILVVFIVIGGLGMGWFKILKETNKLLKEQNEELKNDNKEWQAKHMINEKNIASLQGQIDILKSIPLNDISKTLTEISKTNKANAETNASILALLEKERATDV